MRSRCRFWEDWEFTLLPPFGTSRCSAWIEAGESMDLAMVLSQNAFDSAVVKPAISATAHMTFRTSPAQAGEDQIRLETILSNSGALVQEFMPEINTRGEWSLLFFDGKYSMNGHLFCQAGTIVYPLEKRVFAFSPRKGTLLRG